VTGEHSEMAIKVFIITSHLMFGRGLESLLQQESELKVIGSETNTGQALDKIKELQPDVVVIYADDVRFNSDAMITGIFKVSPQAKVIVMSIHNNLFYVYQAAQRTANDLEDLITAIQADITFSNATLSGKSWGNQEWSPQNFS
jgi:DNA-binding NarL/FixJ family response regulator